MLREECLDHVLALGQRHLEVVLAEYGGHDNADRPHRGLRVTPPLPTARAPCNRSGPVVGRPVLGGLQHVYARAA
jgi:hypothetical protein